MREIKFRIWDKKYRTFDFNASPELFISTYGEVYEKDERSYGMQTYIEYNKSDFYELSQYTGLKDKNGKEIYEGDILKGHYYEYGKKRRFIGKVVYGSHGFWLVGVKQYMGMRQDFYSQYEVLGNSFENPELLETSK
jgi:uncharacterized phage protein (TIGR01671 family)